MTSKSELKRLCTLSPIEMADRLFKAEAELEKLRSENAALYLLIKTARGLLSDEQLDRIVKIAQKS